ncbi:hypothetical protein BKA61DRAFT_583944 [Leptodontidium sp. MPI-SDFR-AT-0119]|nr:hypothetical protein BKA61DRAFT_583944 [Leptodontidium sp. MPI-SDFR-AT-0119]
MSTASTIESESLDAKNTKMATPNNTPTKPGVLKASPIEQKTTSPSCAMPKPSPARIKLTVSPPRIRQVRHSNRERKGISTYNVKALVGTSVHTPRKFTVRGALEKKASSVKAAKALERGPKPPKPAASVRGSADRCVKPQSAPVVPSSLGKKNVQTAIVELPAPMATPANSTMTTVDQSAAIASLPPTPAPVCAIVANNMANPGLPAAVVSLSPSPSKNPFFRIKLVVNYDKQPLLVRSEPDVSPRVTYAGSIVITSKSFTGKVVDKKSVTSKTDRRNRKVTSRNITSKTVNTKIDATKTAATTQDVAKSSAAATSSRKFNNMEPMSLRGSAARKVAGPVKSAESVGATMKRAAPVDHSLTEPVAKRRKTQLIPETVEKDITFYLHTNANGFSSYSVTLTEGQIFKNSGVLKHVLESKANSENNYDTDDELCYDPSTSKEPSKSDTRSISLRPLLTAMLQELDEELNNLDSWDKVNREYIQSLILTPSDKLWELVAVWQSWVQTGEMQLGRCPFQRERMLKFVRVMEMPVEFFRAVKKHEVDVMHKPDEREHEMWKAGLHPEQWADKEERETAKYWSHVGGHKWDYYKARGQ